MTGTTMITVTGNLVAAPELSYTSNGVAVANITIASTPRYFDKKTNEWKDQDTTFLRGSVWRQFAEQIAGSLNKGDRVIATGRLKQRNYQDSQGQNRSTFELEIDELGPSLKHATAAVTRVSTNDPNRSQAQAAGSWSVPAQQTTTDPWGAAGDTEPF